MTATSTVQQMRLTDLGYRVEDMGAEWGIKFAGQYRWVRDEDFGVIQYSENEAWADADQYHRQLQGYYEVQK